MILRILFPLLIVLLHCTCVSAQESPDSLIDLTQVRLDSMGLLTHMAWEEVAGSEKPGYLLSLSKEGNFDEDAVSESARKYRHLLGRWALDSGENSITFSVDAFMAEGLLHPRYRLGRDYYVAYEVIELTPYELQLKDVKTGKLRRFIATEKDKVEDQATKRLPQPVKQTTWTLPDFNGGF